MGSGRAVPGLCGVRTGTARLVGSQAGHCPARGGVRPGTARPVRGQHTYPLFQNRFRAPASNEILSAYPLIVQHPPVSPSSQNSSVHATADTQREKKGLLREVNPGPLAPEARIIPLDQAADASITKYYDVACASCTANEKHRSLGLAILHYLMHQYEVTGC